MCILGVAVGNARFPLVLIHNRDENVARETAPPKIDESGILCAKDMSIPNGGTWLGVNVNEGRVAVLNNCRRCATSVLSPKEFEEVSSPKGNRRAFSPQFSRGKLIMEFLQYDRQPKNLGPPHYAGFNMFWGSLYDSTLHYSTNRYSLANGEEISGVSACSNSFRDNQDEPKTMRLRDLLYHTVSTWEESINLDEAIESLAGILCDTYEASDVPMSVLRSSKPFLGTRDEVPGDADPELGWSVIEEREWQRSIYTQPPVAKEGVSREGLQYKTRTQTIVLVENVDSQRVLHFYMRNSISPVEHEKWISFTLECP